jgi:hypothetical protein
MLLSPIHWGSTSWQWECVAEHSCSAHILVDRKQREEEKGARDNMQLPRTITSDLTP